MKSRASAQRLRLALLLAFTGCLALGSFWALELMRRSQEEQAAELARDAADYTVENFNMIRLGTDGTARYNIAGARLTHFPKDDSVEIATPHLHSLAPGRAPITIHAQKAIVENASRKVHLHDKVQVERPASAEGQYLHASTDYLLILPDDDIIKTDKPVRLVLGNTLASAAGMEIDNTARTLHAWRVRGASQPGGQNQLAEPHGETVQ